MFLNYGKTIFFLQLIPKYDMVTNSGSFTD